MAIPVVITQAAKFITKHTATLTGSTPYVDSAVGVAYVIFQYGKSVPYSYDTFFSIATSEGKYRHDIENLEPNTTYHFRLACKSGGRDYYGEDVTFTTTAIELPLVSLPFLISIVQIFNDIASWLYSIYIEVFYFPYPISELAPFFYSLHLLFNTLAWRFLDFTEFLEDLAAKVYATLSLDSIYDYFKDYFDKALVAWQWIQDATDYIYNAVSSYYDWLHRLILQIGLEVEYLISQIPTLSEVIFWWSNWWGNIQTELEAWWSNKLLDIRDLIESAFTVRRSYWEGWQELRQTVTEFFTDPLEWFYKKMDEFIERYW